MKALEDLSVHYDNTVRNSVHGRGGGASQSSRSFQPHQLTPPPPGVVQFKYGDDSLDPSLMEADGSQPINFSKLFMHAQVEGGGGLHARTHFRSPPTTQACSKSQLVIFPPQRGGPLRRAVPPNCRRLRRRVTRHLLLGKGPR
jgi:hypothetical protein